MIKKLILLSLISSPAYADYNVYVLQKMDFKKKNGIFTPVLNKAISTKKLRRSIGVMGDKSGITYDIRYNIIKDNKDSRYKTKDAGIKVQTLYKDFDINHSTSVHVGRFVENWQVGYYFNPLAVVDPHQENSSIDNPLGDKTGLNAITVNHISGENEYTFYAGKDSEKADTLGYIGNRYTALKFSRPLSDDTDLTVVAQQKNTGNWGLGSGFRTILNDKLEIHGSFFSRRSTQLKSHEDVYKNASSFSLKSTNPINAYRKNDGRLYSRAMIGMQYQTENKTSFYFELGLDQRLMNDTQWATYKKMVKSHSSSNNTGNLLWDASLNNPNGLRQQYSFFRISNEYKVYKASGTVRMGKDFSGLGIIDLQFLGTKNLVAGLKFSSVFGSGDSEYGGYFPYKNSAGFYIHKEF